LLTDCGTARLNYYAISTALEWLPLYALIDFVKTTFFTAVALCNSIHFITMSNFTLFFARSALPRKKTVVNATITLDRLKWSFFSCVAQSVCGSERERETFSQLTKNPLKVGDVSRDCSSTAYVFARKNSLALWLCVCWFYNQFFVKFDRALYSGLWESHERKYCAWCCDLNGTPSFPFRTFIALPWP
jgi:hypothetical protein